MKKVLCIILAVVLVILIGLGIIAYINRNTIAALFDAVKYTEEEVLQQAEQNQKDLQDFIDNEEDISVRDLTDEEKKALNDKKITEQEALLIMTGETTLEELIANKTQTEEEGQEKIEKPSEEQNPTGEPSSATTTEIKEQTDPNKRISELIGLLYVEKNTRLSAFDSLKAQVYQEYKSIEGVAHETKKWDLINKYTPVLAQWESDCDSVVFGIIDEIKVELKKAGKDESIATKLKESYMNEKKLKKASLAANYLD